MGSRLLRRWLCFPSIDINEINKKIIGEGYNFVMSNQPKKRVEVAQKIDQMSRREMFDVGLANQEA